MTECNYSIATDFLLMFLFVPKLFAIKIIKTKSRSWAIRILGSWFLYLFGTLADGKSKAVISKFNPVELLWTGIHLSGYSYCTHTSRLFIVQVLMFTSNLLERHSILVKPEECKYMQWKKVVCAVYFNIMSSELSTLQVTLMCLVRWMKWTT